MEIPMQTFEYLKRDDFVSVYELARLGKEGWELVTVVNPSGLTHLHADLLYFFKRPISDS